MSTKKADSTPKPTSKFAGTPRGVYHERAMKGMRVIHVTDAEDRARRKSDLPKGPGEPPNEQGNP